MVINFKAPNQSCMNELAADKFSCKCHGNYAEYSNFYTSNCDTMLSASQSMKHGPEGDFPSSTQLNLLL